MEYEQVVTHFQGLSKAARALKADRRTVHAWRDRPRIPSRWQLKIEKITSGALAADDKAREDAQEFASYAA